MKTIENGIGPVIKELRLEMNKTQEVLADESGYNDQSHLSAIECGKVDPCTKTANKILEPLGYELVVRKKEG